MRYIGSKKSVVHQVFDIISADMSGPRRTFCDPFGGMAVVGGLAKEAGFRVVAGDLLTFPHYMQSAKLELNQVPSFLGVSKRHHLNGGEDVLSFLNELPKAEGWLTVNYARERSFFQVRNAQQADAIWLQIEDWKRQEILTRTEENLLVASLIESLDRVANTAGTYGAYLKTWHRKATKDFQLRFVKPSVGEYPGRAVLGSAEDLVSQLEDVQVLYLDPPYNTRRYDYYYHLPESIARSYRGPVKGVAGLPIREEVVSKFNRKHDAISALSSLVSAPSWQSLVLHYSDDGLIEPPEIRALLSSFGSTHESEVIAKGYSTIRSGAATHRIYRVERH